MQIYFDTATFDDIERDKKVKSDELSIIGGTMGLLTGFSVISGFEIIFYLIKLISSSVSFTWADIVAKTKKKLAKYCVSLMSSKCVNKNSFV